MDGAGRLLGFPTVRHRRGLRCCPFVMIIIETDSSEKRIDFPFERIHFSKKCSLQREKLRKP